MIFVKVGFDGERHTLKIGFCSDNEDILKSAMNILVCGFQGHSKRESVGWELEGYKTKWLAMKMAEFFTEILLDEFPDVEVKCVNDDVEMVGYELSQTNILETQEFHEYRPRVVAGNLLCPMIVQTWI